MPTTQKSGVKYYMRDYRRRKREEREADTPLVLPDVPATGKGKVRALKQWAESCLIVPADHPGLAGKAFILQDWQCAFLEKALDRPGMESLLSVARKSGKTGLISALVLAHLCEGGPLVIPSWRGCIISISRKHAGELMRQCGSLIDVSGLQGVEARKTPYPGRLLGYAGGELEIISGAHGGQSGGYNLAICDELGLLPGEGKSRESLAAVRSSLSTRSGSFMAISIQGDSELLQEMIQRKDLPSTHVVVYAADSDCRLDDREQWKKANPSLGIIKQWDHMERAAERAAETKNDEHWFRAHELNIFGSPEVELLCSVSDWLALETDDLPARSGPCYAGLDLGQSRSMSCLTLYFPESKRIEGYGCFPCTPTLLKRGQSDGVGSLYATMFERGELVVLGERIVDIRGFLTPVLQDVGDDLVAIGFDRYRSQEAEMILDDVGFRGERVPRGQGASAVADGSTDIRQTVKAIKERKISVRESLLYRSGLRFATIGYDLSGNPRLNKVRVSARIDIIQSLVIAVGIASLRRENVVEELAFFDCSPGY